MSPGSAPERALDRGRRALVWSYRLLARLLPADFREEDGPEVVAVYGDRLRDAMGWRAVGWAGGRGLWDLARTILAEWTETAWEAGMGKRSRVAVGMDALGALIRLGVEDLRRAARSLSKSPGFSLTVGSLVALGVSATLIVAGLARAILITPLPFPDSERVVTVWLSTEDFPKSPLSVPGYRFLRDHARAFDRLEARWTSRANLVREGRVTQLAVGHVTPGYFELLGVRPESGRLPEPGEGTVAISHSLWMEQFAGDRAAVGASLQLGDASLRVVGVMPDGVVGMPTFEGGADASDVWRPLNPDWLDGDDWVLAWLRVVGRIRAGSTVPQTRAEIDRLMPEIARLSDRPEDSFAYALRAAKAELAGQARPAVAALSVAVLLLLLIAVSNVANLAALRGVRRSGAMAIRSALGASPADLVRQVSMETAVLAVAAGAAGTAVSAGVLDLLAANPRWSDAGFEPPHVDGAFAGAALLLAAVVAVAGGLLPSLRVIGRARPDLLTSRRSIGSPHGRTLGRSLVAIQFALTLCLLSSTLILLRAVSRHVDTWPGFEPSGAVSAWLHPADRFENGAAALAYFRELEDRLSELPDVAAVGFANLLPLHGGIYGGPYTTRDDFESSGQRSEADFRFVTPGHLEAMGGRLLGGRFFEPEDGPDPVVIDDVLAASVFGGIDPLGQEVWTGTLGREGAWSTVIGVVAHQRHETPLEDGGGTIYFPAWAHIADGWPYFPGGSARLAMRARPGASLAPERVREIVAEVDALSTTTEVRELGAALRETAATTQLTFRVLTLFALVGVLLSSVGLYVIVAHAVSEKTAEIGIRKALGARTGELVRHVVAFGGRSLLVGAVVGTLLSLRVGSALQGVIAGVEPTDPVVVLAALGLLVLTSASAVLVPARRALRLDPIDALGPTRRRGG